MARILVGIPTWNRPQFVREAIQSVQQQTEQDIRVVVSDNCSPGTIADEVSAYVETLDDPRFEFVSQTVNRGEKGQMDFFLSQCREEFIVFLHDDDRMEPDLLRCAVQVLDQHPDIDFYCSDQYAFDAEGAVLDEESNRYRESLERDQLSEGPVPDMLVRVLRRGIFSISGSVFRTRSLRECGLQDSASTYPCDFNVFLRQAERGRKGWWDPRTLAGYRFHDSQARDQCDWEYNEAFIDGYREMLEPRHFEGRAEQTRSWLLSFAYRRLAYIHFSQFRFSAGYRALARAIQSDPKSARMWAYAVFAGICPFLIRPLWGKRVTPLATTH